MPYINDKHYSAKGLSINRTSKAMKENSIKSSTNPSKLKDIMKKIHNYRLSLNQELLKILTEEREKEKKREIIVGNCAKEDDKLRLENLFAIERALYFIIYFIIYKIFHYFIFLYFYIYFFIYN